MRGSSRWRGASARERVAQVAEEAGEALRRGSRGTARAAMRESDDAVLERVAGARRRLRAVAEHPPAAVGRAREVGGVERAGSAARARATPWHGRRKPGMREHELGRQQALAQQPLRAVEIGEDRVRAARARCASAARRSRATRRPRCSERDRVELPRPVHAARVAVDVVGDAVLADQPPRRAPSAARSSARPERVERARRSALPVRRAARRRRASISS